MTRLSTHFTLDELLRGSGESAAPAHVLLNARRTAEVLETVRRQLGDVPIVPTSWWRPPAKNADTAGSARDSAHLYGYGVDFKVSGMTSREIVALLAPHVRGLPIDQLIDERDHVHLSADPRMRRQVLVEVVEGQYLPWQGAGTTTGPTIGSTAGPTIKASPEVVPGVPGSRVWWLALLGAVILAALNFLSKSSTP